MFGKADLERRLRVLEADNKHLKFRVGLAEGDHAHDVHMRMVHLKRIESLERRTASCGIAYGDVYAQRAAEWGCTREAAKARMFAESLGYSPVYVSKLKDYVPQLKAAADKNPFKPGDRVAYVGEKGVIIRWYGIVCPCPANLPLTSRVSGQRFTYVVTDSGRVVGCYAHRIVRA